MAANVSTFQASTAALAQTIALPAPKSDERWQVSQLNASVGVAALTNITTVSLQDNGVTIWQEVLPAAAAVGQAVNRNFVPPIDCGIGDAVSLVVSAPGGTSVTYASIAASRQVGT